MAKETIEAVLRAEENAAQIEKDAVTKGEALVQKAKEDAKSLVASMTKEKNLQKETDLKAAHVQVDKYIETAIKQAEQDIVMLNEIVKNKEQAAISLVLKEIL